MLDDCISAWLKPSRQIAAVDAIFDAISASYTIGPARISLIQGTTLYPACVHAAATTIDSAADLSSQKRTWHRLARLGDVDFAVDTAHYSKVVYNEACRALEANDLKTTSSAVKRVWEEHGLLPHTQREPATCAEAFQIIEENNR